MTTMDDLFRLVQRDYLDNKRKSTYQLHLQITRQLAPYFGRMEAHHITPAEIEQYKHRRLSSGAARATINLELSTIRRALKLGHELGLIGAPATVKQYAIGNSNRRTGFFSPDDLAAMLNVCGRDQADIMLFAYGSGWRLGEIRPLTWKENYDVHANVIRIFDSKSGAGRSLPLNPMPGLNDIIKRRKALKVKDCDFIFNHGGKIYDPKTFNRHWNEASRRAGVSYHFHDLRRTAIRDLTRSGVHRAVAMSITGHKTESVFNRYDIVDQADISQGLAKLNAYRINQNPLERSDDQP